MISGSPKIRRDVVVLSFPLYFDAIPSNMLLFMREAEKIARKNKAQRIALEVRPSNAIALALYKDLGFIETGLRKAYYSNNQEDAIVMTKFLYDVQ